MQSESKNDVETQIKNTDRIKELISLKSILDDAGIKHRKNRCDCPFCSGESKLTFSVSDERGFGYCFRCNFSGDIFRLYQELNSCDFKTALTGLANRCGVSLSLPYPTSKNSNEPKSEFEIKREALRKELRLKGQKEKKVRREFQCREEILTNLACYYVQRLQQTDKDFAKLDQEKLEAINLIRDNIEKTRIELSEYVREA